MFPFVREQLSRAVQDVAALRPNAMDVVAHLREPALLERTHLVLHELLESVARQLLVFDVVRLVFLCNKTVRFVAVQLVERTHVGLVLEGEATAGPAAVEVRGPLAEEGAVGGAALLGGAVPLEALLDDGGVLAVVVGVHLDVGRRNVYFITAFLDAMIVGLLLVVGAVAEAVAAVVEGAVAHEAVLQGLVALLVPLEVADHFFFFDEDAGVAVEAVEVLPGRFRGLVKVGGCSCGYIKLDFNQKLAPGCLH